MAFHAPKLVVFVSWSNVIDAGTHKSLQILLVKLAQPYKYCVTILLKLKSKKIPLGFYCG